MEAAYIHTIDDFMKAHPEIDPSLKPVIEPVIQGAEDQLFNFIIGYIFM
ncbi:MAG: hypothetical protein LBG73_09340 [Spirochaetaceae bacterium]|nr:hypothetical protein [Spirochaetaceae bacterium]